MDEIEEVDSVFKDHTVRPRTRYPLRLTKDMASVMDYLYSGDSSYLPRCDCRSKLLHRLSEAERLADLNDGAMLCCRNLRDLSSRVRQRLLDEHMAVGPQSAHDEFVMEIAWGADIHYVAKEGGVEGGTGIGANDLGSREGSRSSDAAAFCRLNDRADDSLAQRSCSLPGRAVRISRYLAVAEDCDLRLARHP